MPGQTKNQRHQLLAKYFASKSISYQKGDKKFYNIRKLSELPFQLTLGEDWDGLFNTLTNPDIWEGKCMTVTLGVDCLLMDFIRVLDYHKKKILNQNIYSSYFNLFYALYGKLWAEASVLRKYPDLVIQQIWNRLYWSEDIPSEVKQNFKKVFDHKRSLGIKMLFALVPPQEETDENIQTLKLNEKIIRLSMNIKGLLAFDRKGKWYLMDSKGKINLEGEIVTESLKQVCCNGVCCVTLSGNILSYWRQWPEDNPFVFQSGWPVSSIDLNETGHLLAVGETGDWVVYDLSVSKPIRIYQGKIQSKAISCAISSDGRIWAIGDENGHLHIINDDKSEIIKSHNNPVKILDFSRNNNQLLTLTGNGKLYIYQRDGQLLFTLYDFFITHAYFEWSLNSILAVTSSGDTLNIINENNKWEYDIIFISSRYLHWISRFHNNGPIVVFNDEGFIQLFEKKTINKNTDKCKFKLPQQAWVGLVPQTENCYILADRGGGFWKYDFEKKPSINLIHDEKASLKSLLNLHSNSALVVYLNRPHSYCSKIIINPDFKPPQKFWPLETKEGYYYTLMFSSVSPNGKFLLFGLRTVDPPKKTKIEIFTIPSFEKVHTKITNGWWTNATISDTGIFSIFEEDDKDSLKIYNKELQLQGNCSMENGDPLSHDSDGKMLLAIDSSRTTWLFKDPWESNCKIQVLPNIWTGRLSSDGQMIVLIDIGGFVHILDSGINSNSKIKSIAEFPLGWLPHYCSIYPKRSEIHLTGENGFQIIRWN